MKAQKKSIEVDGEVLVLQPTAWQALEGMYEQLGGTVGVAQTYMHLMTAKALARMGFITFKEQWARIDASFTERGAKAVAASRRHVHKDSKVRSAARSAAAHQVGDECAADEQS